MAFTYDIRAMLRKFGVVTVMDVKAYETVLFATPQEESQDGKTAAYSVGEWDAIATLWGRETGGTASQTATVKPLFTLDSLKIANINQEGPTKSITGGQNADVLLKYGKTMTIEMQDALGRYEVLDELYGVNFSANHQIAEVTDRFPGEITLVGTTFVIDQKTGAKQPIHIVIPRFLGDGIFNLSQDAEGDASVFDMNGNILKFDTGTVEDSKAITDTVIAGLEASDDTHEWDGKLYGKGADNAFYFLCTKQALDLLAQNGYREASVGELADNE